MLCTVGRPRRMSLVALLLVLVRPSRVWCSDVLLILLCDVPRSTWSWWSYGHDDKSMQAQHRSTKRHLNTLFWVGPVQFECHSIITLQIIVYSCIKLHTISSQCQKENTISDSACGALHSGLLKKSNQGGRMSWSNSIISLVAITKTL